MVSVPVNPKVLIWARKERGLTPTAAAKRLGISEADLDEIESATTLPITQLRNIASKYAITFASLLMPEPLPASTRIQVKDFRATGGKPQADYDLFVELDDLNNQIDLLAEIKLADPELFRMVALPRATLTSEPEHLADQERKRIGISILEQVSWDKDTQAFRRWRGLAEAQGVFVYSLNLGPTRVCRGLSILDERNVPIAVVNSEEGSYRARNFTLWHEYAHLLLRETGISDENRKNEVERFCNQFSAFFLMPRAAFAQAASAIAPKGGKWTDYHVKRLGAQFRVTMTVASIHMEDTGIVPADFYKELRGLWAMHRPKNKGGIATPAEKKLNKYGVRHVDLVLTALDRGRINQLDARELLDAKPKDFGAIRNEAKARQDAYGGAG
jgi:Zn-dependent peptidase ImmA (M78 family)/transcriptional regulator with XRE-family HTH domain